MSAAFPRLAGLAAGLGLALLAAAAPAAADAALAEPGECARAAPGRSLVRPVVETPDRPLVADPAALLGLAAVSAPPGGSLFPSPDALGFPGTDACDKPGSGCMGPILPGPTRPTPATTGGGRAPTIRESPSGPAPPPGLP